MNPDDHLQQYFSARAEEITVPRTGTPALAERARRRRHRRTGVKVGAVVGVLAIGAGVIAQRGDDGQDVASYGNAVVPTDLQWTAVTPQAGLGSSSSFATTADGTVYGLSTAPGRPSPTSTGEPKRLYRSADGAEWATTDLPDDLWASDLAADGDRLYAIGTSPAGGGSERARLAVSVGDGGGWADVDLPLDLEAAGAGSPARAELTSVQVASAGDASVVSIGVTADIWALPQIKGKDARLGADGVDLIAPLECEGTDGTAPSTTLGDATVGTTAADPAGAPVTITAEGADAAKRAEKEAAGACTEADDEDLRVTHHYSWADLGIAESAVDLVLGRTYVFHVAADGVVSPAGTLPAGSSVNDLVAGADGFWVLASRSSIDGSTVTNEAYFSADGTAWATDRPVALPGYPMAAGLFGGQPAVATSGDGPEGEFVLATLTPEGARPIDVGATLRDLVGDGSLSAAAFGPLGFAGVVTSEDGSAAVVHGGGDGTFSVVPIAGEAEGSFEQPAGVDVSADAITVRLLSTVPGELPTDGTTNGRLRLFVGTPG